MEEQLTANCPERCAGRLVCAGEEQFSDERNRNLTLAVVQINGWNRLANLFGAGRSYQPGKAMTTAATA